MKKLALFLVLMMIPCTVFGLEMLTDNALEEVTGQSGVSIAFDDVQLFLNVDRFAYIDCDGYSTNSNYGGTCESSLGGAFVIEGFQMDMLNINMIGVAGYGAQWYEGKDIGGSWAHITLASAAANELNVYEFYRFASSTDDQINALFYATGSEHIALDGNAYGLGWDEGGTQYYRNRGNQTVDNALLGGSALGYTPGYFTSSVYTNYTGSLPLASAACGSVPLFYDYGQTTGWGGCNLSTTYTTTSRTNNRGLNHYINTNNLSTLGTFHPQAVTIDVTASLPLHTSGLAKAADPGSNLTIGGVLIGLPTAEFHIQELHIGALKFTAEIDTYNPDYNGVTNKEAGNQNMNLNTGNTFAEDTKNSGADFGVIIIEGVTFTTFGGWMEIAPTEFKQIAGD